VAGFGLEALNHRAQHRLETLHRDLALVAVEDLDEARHMGALEVVGQADIHVERRHRVLHAAGLVGDLYRVADRLDADLVDRDLAAVGAALHVGDGELGGGVHGLFSAGLSARRGPMSERHGRPQSAIMLHF
jgi:hypothetical protein